jgi:4-amino-4-deoxychorismate lyase
MSWAAHHNMPLQVRDVVLDEVLHADELFVVNSIIGMWPIRELEQRYWSDFPITAKIRHELNGSRT